MEKTLELLRSLPSRSGTADPAGLEAHGAVVVGFENIEAGAAKLVTQPPAPQIGDPLRYETFVRRICDRYAQRWS